MTHPLPPELERLLSARGSTARERAWDALIAEWTPLLLHVARSVFHERDAAMDAYAAILEQLRQRDYHRLRQFSADGRSRFSTWLVVIAKRICVDVHRRRYGRVSRAESAAAPGAAAERTARVRLADLVGDSLDVDVAATEDDAEARLRRTELREHLSEAIAGLAPADRLLLALRFEDDVPVRDIAGMLGMPTPFHVYRALNRVLGLLRTHMEARGVTDPTP